MLVAGDSAARLPGCRPQLIRFRLLPGPGQRRDPAGQVIKEFPGLRPCGRRPGTARHAAGLTLAAAGTET